MLLSLYAVLDQTAQTLFLTEMMRGMSLTLRAFFDKKVTVRFFPFMPCSSESNHTLLF